MITIAVHTQNLMSGRMDLKCPNCQHRSCFYPNMTVPKQCPDCNFMLPDVKELYKSKLTRVHWHFFKVFTADA